VPVRIQTTGLRDVALYLCNTGSGAARLIGLGAAGADYELAPGQQVRLGLDDKFEHFTVRLASMQGTTVSLTTTGRRVRFVPGVKKTVTRNRDHTIAAITETAVWVEA
jgi:hypothetical protein